MPAIRFFECSQKIVWLAQKVGGTTTGNRNRIYNYYNSVLCLNRLACGKGERLSFCQNLSRVRGGLRGVAGGEKK